ncbi:carbohydrate ABC transporter permease [Candidatus Mycoplasma pogonae]
MKNKLFNLMDYFRNYFENQKRLSLATKKDAFKFSLKFSSFLLILIIAVAWLLPFAFMINTSFKDIRQIITESIFSSPNPYSVVTYQNAWRELDFANSFFTTLLITVASNFFIVFFSSLAAWQLARMNKWYSKAIFYMFLIVMIVPFQALMLPLMVIVGKMSLLNIPGLIFMYTGFGMSFSIFIMHGFLSGIPLSLEEAAKVEGYGPLRIYFKIILPLLKPIITTVIILNTMAIWNDFLLPYLVYQANPNGWTTAVVNLYKGLFGTYGTDYTALMAGLTILIIPITVFFVFMQKNIVSGITNGAVK